MGLFGVHMPPLYGEGKNAFARLQMEIISKTDDDSIFAFEGDAPKGICTMLARSPKEFADSWSIVRNIWDPDRPAHTMSSKGLCVHFQLVSHWGGSFAPLNCTRKYEGTINSEIVVGFNVKKQSVSNIWVRGGYLTMIQINRVTLVKKPRAILYAERNDPTDVLFLVHRFSISIRPLSVAGFVPKKHVAEPVSKSAQQSHWGLDGDQCILTLVHVDCRSEHWQLEHASVLFEDKNHLAFELVIGLLDNRPWVDILIINEVSGGTTEGDSLIVKRDLLVGRDKTSRPFLKGALNARLQGLPRREGYDIVHSIVVTFDLEPKWPD